MEQTQGTNDYTEDDYGAYEEDNYYKKNTKNDSGATRFKKIPLHRITLESVCPEEPQEKHDKPNDKHYEKELKRIDDEINNHKKNKEELFKKIGEERVGNNPERKKLLDHNAELKVSIDILNKKIEKLSEGIKGPLEREKKLKEQKEKLEKECDVKNLKILEKTIKEIQEQLGFGSLSASDEKKAMDKKARLEAQLPKTKKLEEVRTELTALKESNKVPFEELKKLRDEVKPLILKRTSNNEALNKISEVKDKNEPKIAQLTAEKESIGLEIKRLTQLYYDTEREWNEKWRKFEVYMEKMEYIKEFKKKQAEIKKREEKLKKKEEKDAKKQGASTTTEVEIKVEKLNETSETQNCKQLISYFTSLIEKKEEKKEEKNQANSASDKINAELKKGDLVEFNRDAITQETVLGIEGKTKKKNKGPKVSKREQEFAQTEFLVLGIDICNIINELGLNPPSKKSQVEAFIKTLENHLAELKKKLENNK